MGAANRVKTLCLAAAGILLLTCFVGMAVVGDLRTNLTSFLLLNTAAYLVYGAAVWWVARRQVGERVWILIFGFAVLFRLALLFSTPPTLSDDVYRYMWDGHLLIAGVNPYAHAVNSPLLDPLGTSYRLFVNNNWMASPYLPAAQVYFALVAAIAPGSPLAFQTSAVVFDLLTGLIMIGLLRRLRLPASNALIFLWSPLVIVEFAHGAHVDSLMVCLTMAAVWMLVARRSQLGSAVALAAATLTKGIPMLLVPVLARRWGWKGVLAFAAAIVAACLPLSAGAGLGLGGPQDGVGLFGAIRIYGSQWTFNGGLHHWIEAALGRSPWAVEELTRASRAVTAGLMAVVLAVAWLRTRRRLGDVQLVRLALVPLCGYLMLTTTLHPWYVTAIIPLIPFLLKGPAESTSSARFVVPWLVLAALVPLSYLAYRDPQTARVPITVRLVQYVPLYLWLGWAAWPAAAGALRSLRRRYAGPVRPGRM